MNKLILAAILFGGCTPIDDLRETATAEAQLAASDPGAHPMTSELQHLVGGVKTDSDCDHDPDTGSWCCVRFGSCWSCCTTTWCVSGCDDPGGTLPK